MGRFPHLNGPCAQSIVTKTGNTLLLRCSLFALILPLSLRPNFIIVPAHSGAVHVQFPCDPSLVGHVRVLPQVGGNGLLPGIHPVGILRASPGAKGGDLRLHLQDQPFELLFALLPGMGIDVAGPLFAVWPHRGVAALPEVLVDLADTPGARPAAGQLYGYKGLLLLPDSRLPLRLRLHLRRCDPLVDVQGSFPSHLVGDVGIGIQCGRRGDMTDDGGEGLHIHPVFQGQGGESVPLRYNYDKPEKPRKIKGFEVFSLIF